MVAFAGLFAITGARSAEASCIPGFDYAAFGKNSVTFGGDSTCDSWNSAAGSYAATQSNSGGNLGTDGTSAGAITVHGTAASAYGNLYYGVGGGASSVTINGHPTTGTSGALTSDLALPSVAIPSPFGSNLGAIAGGSPAANDTYSTVSGNVTLSNGTYVIDTLTANVTVSSGTVVVYIKTSFNPGSINNTTGVAGNLIFLVGPSVATISLTNVGGYYAIYAPDTDIDIHGNQDIYGAVISKSLAISGTPSIHYDTALSSATAGSFACATPELSRGEPIVATVSGSTAVVQGSLVTPAGSATTVTVAGDLAGFVFPFIQGHMRARVASTITTAATTFASGTILFDAATAIPTVTTVGCGANAYKGTCRTVFTTTQAPTHGVSLYPPKVLVQDGNADAIGALIAPALVHAQWVTLVDRLLAGTPSGATHVAKLGGIDRSTVAIIGASSFAGGSRPTITYAGATDGMLHAFCASVDAAHGCDVLGRELWAFIPRVQLPYVRLNTTRIDGSPRVTDMFGDFTGSGQRTFRTILTFQTGSGDPTTAGQTPAVYALDITDPQNPSVVWEYTVATPAARGATDFGAGESLATATALVNGVQTPVVYAETKNGGTGGAGVVVTAIRADTGATLWQFGQVYGAARVGGHTAPPSTGIPGGAVAIDAASQGYATDIVFADLYGSLWKVDPLTGASRYGSGVPLFRFSTDYLPIGAVPAIYMSGGQLYAAFASGGYTDPTDTASSWGTATTQELVVVRLQPTVSPPPSLTEASGAPNVPVAITLGANERSFAEVTVVGTQLFVTTDTTDVNASGYGTSGSATGNVHTYDLASGHAGTTLVVASGASAVANNGTTLYSSSGQTQQQLTTGANTTVGSKVDSQDIIHTINKLWLRTQ